MMEDSIRQISGKFSGAPIGPHPGTPDPGFGFRGEKLVAKMLPLGLICSGAVIFFAASTGQGEKTYFLAFPAFFAPALAAHLLRLYSLEERKRKIEEQTPDLLLLASSLPGVSSLPKIAQFMAVGNSGPLAEEFAIARAEMAAGMPAEEALSRIGKRNSSAALTRAIGMIIAALDSGANMRLAFRETAEDFMHTQSIMRERAAATAMQKYTLLLAGGALVPFILGKLGAMVEGFSLSSVSEIGIGMPQAQRISMQSAVSLASAVYIAEFALIASAFIAMQEGRPRRAIVYALGLLPAGLLVYFLSRGGA